MDSSPANSSTLDRKSSRFRIQDSGRALWLITAFVLVSGLVALRALTGGANAPTIDVEAIQSAPAVELEEDDGLHKLRPQTSATSPLSGHGLDVNSADREPPVLMPAAHWDPLLPHGWLDEPAIEVGVKNEKEILR